MYKKKKQKTVKCKGISSSCTSSFLHANWIETGLASLVAETKGFFVPVGPGSNMKTKIVIINRCLFLCFKLYRVGGGGGEGGVMFATFFCSPLQQTIENEE